MRLVLLALVAGLAFAPLAEAHVCWMCPPFCEESPDRIHFHYSSHDPCWTVPFLPQALELLA